MQRAEPDTVVRVLVGLPGHRTIRGQRGPAAEWQMSWPTVPDAPEWIREQLRSYGKRLLRRMLDLGWVTDDDLAAQCGLASRVEVEARRRVEEHAVEAARLRSYAPAPIPSPRPLAYEKPIDFGWGKK
jgi:hypothetical protein